MLLSKVQANTVYEAICVLGNIGATARSIQVTPDIEVICYTSGGISITNSETTPSRREVYDEYDDFVDAYELNITEWDN